MAHEAQGARLSSAAPTCLRAAGQARKSQRFLRSPGPEAFSSFQAGHSPTGRSSLASSFQAGAEGWGQGSALQALAAAQALGAGDAWGLWDIIAVLARPLQGLLGPRWKSCPCPGTDLTKSPCCCCCCCSWGGRAQALRGGLKCSGRTLPAQTSSSSTVGWHWRNDNPQHPRAGGACGWDTVSCPTPALGNCWVWKTGHEGQDRTGQ